MEELAERDDDYLEGRPMIVALPWSRLLVSGGCVQCGKAREDTGGRYIALGSPWLVSSTRMRPGSPSGGGSRRARIEIRSSATR